MSLAILHFTGVTPEKFAILQNSATKEMGGGNHTETSGTISDHGATAGYSYDGVNVLTITVEKIGRVFFHKPSLEDVSKGISAWIEDTLAEALANATAANEVKPLVDTTKPLTTTTTNVVDISADKIPGTHVVDGEIIKDPTPTPTPAPFTGTLSVDPITNQPVSK
jgi:hypothetical protein